MGWGGVGSANGCGLLDGDDHGVGAYEVLDAGGVEAGFVHPGDAVGGGVVEAARGFDEHVEAHEEAHGVLGAVVVDDGLVGDKGSAGGEGFVGFADEHFFGGEVPVVEDVAHHDDVGGGEGAVEEAAGMEADAAGEAVGGDVVLEDGADFGEVKADAGEVGVGESDLRDEVALGGADVDGGGVVLEGELAGDGHVGAVADAGHGFEEAAETVGIGVEGGEGAGFAGAGLVLGLAGAEGGGEVGPGGIKALVGHLEDAADVGGLVFVEEEVGGGGVVVEAVAALEEVEGDEGVEEVVGGAGMEAEAGAELGERTRLPGELGEDLHFDGAEEGFGGPEAEAYLQDVVGKWLIHGGSVLGILDGGRETRCVRRR